MKQLAKKNAFFNFFMKSDFIFNFCLIQFMELLYEVEVRIGDMIIVFFK